MYAYDVMFMGEWSKVNFVNLNRILRCFYMALGLKMNVHKSRVVGIGWMILMLLDLLIFFIASRLLFHLLFPIGANMKLAKNWSTIVDRFKAKLSLWKARNLSFGGRLTLIKSVLRSLPLFYFSLFKAPSKVIELLKGLRRRFLWGGIDSNRKIHWVACEKVAKPKKLGGLGVSDLRSMNIALLAKWWWRLKTESNSIWTSCINALHNTSCIDGKLFAKCGIPGTWLNIYQISWEWELKDWDISLDGLFGIYLLMSFFVEIRGTLMKLIFGKTNGVEIWSLKMIW